MIFTRISLSGAYLVTLNPIADERGFFARSWCRNEFASRGLNPNLVQCNITSSQKRGTLRGMHYQKAPHEEVKIVRCTKGAIYDVIIDLRPTSPTFKQWFGVELTADNHFMLYIPTGFAHGCQTLQDESEIFYQMSEFYHPESAASVRWDDPAFGIQWPDDSRIISRRDQDIADFLV